MVSFFDDISMNIPEFSNSGWPEEKDALQIWEIMHNKCNVPLKHRIPYRRATLNNGIKYIAFGKWFAITNHPEVYDPLNSEEEIWILKQSNLSCVARVSQGRYIRYPQRR